VALYNDFSSVAPKLKTKVVNFLSYSPKQIQKKIENVEYKTHCMPLKNLHTQKF